MRPSPRLLVLAIAALVIALVLVIDHPSATAELENQVFTSKPDGLSMVVPRGWRATDLPSYPGLLLWMMRSQPDGKIVLTADGFTRAYYCAWPIQCRTSHETPARKFACAVRQQLQNQHMRMQDVQAGPKENEEAGIPSVWFEYDDGRHFFRQAFVVTEDRAVTLVLSAPSIDARTQQVRAFEQALRSLHPVTAAELATAPTAQATPDDAGVVVDGGLADAQAAGPVHFQAAPAAKQAPIGPCS